MGVKVSLAEHLGFCFGVRRALRIAEKALREAKGDVYSLGPLIHNPRVVEKLEKKGLKTVPGLHRLENGTLIVRSHGIHPVLAAEARKKGLRLIDAACPYVASAQRKAALLRKAGYRVVIFGDRNHPEVKALLGVTAGRAVVVERGTDVSRLLRKREKIGLVAQTTQPGAEYAKIIAALARGNFRELRVFNTICSATAERQEAARRLSRRVELMIVVGGRASANTGRLTQICRQAGIDTYQVEGAEQIKPQWRKGKRHIGVTGGASTPQWLIEEVVKKLQQSSKPR